MSSRKIGIDAIAIAVPRTFLEGAELATARGVPPSKYEKGLGVRRLAIAGPEDDPVTLATNAARRLLRSADIDPRTIGMCVVGTETAVDHSKPIASYVHGMLGLPAACRVFETKHACYGATAAIMSAVEWIASGAARGRAALVIATDIARYEMGSPGEPTQGAGAVAVLVTEDPRLLELEVGRSGTFARDVHDFWRPLHRKDALVDGHFSVQCYLDALAGAFEGFTSLDREDGTPDPLVRTCYHVPYGKMAQKAHRRRLASEGVGDADADARFAREVEPSLAFSAEIGNVYTASLWLALASLLHGHAAELEGERIGLFSYGSGCGAEFFAGRVARGAGAFVRLLDLAAPLESRVRLTVEEYEALRRGEIDADRRRAPEPEERARSSSDVDSDAIFLGVDENERRVYADVRIAAERVSCVDVIDDDRATTNATCERVSIVAA